MADRYWIATSSQTWNPASGTYWSATSGGAGGASPPGAGDNAIFDQPGTKQVALVATAAISVFNITVADGAGPFTFTGGNSGGISIYGSMYLGTGCAVWAANNSPIFFLGSGSHTIYTGGLNLGCPSATGITFGGTGTWTANSNFSVSYSTLATLTSGTLNLNNYTFACGTFSSSNTNVRSIVFGTGNITVSQPVIATPVAMANTTNFTCSGTGGFVNTVVNAARTYTVGTTGGSTAGMPNISTGDSNTPIHTFTTGGWFGIINFGTSSTATLPATSLNVLGLVLSPAGNYGSLTATLRGTGTLIGNGNTTLTNLTINHTGTTTLLSAFTLSATATTNLTSGTLDLGGFNLTTGLFTSSNSNTRSIVFGTNNIVLAHTTAATLVLSMTPATGFTWSGTTGGFTTTATITRSFTFGVTGGSAANAVNLSITSGSAVQSFTDGTWYKFLNFNGSSFTCAVTASFNGIFVDTLTLATGGTYTALIPIFTRTQTWTAQFSKQLGGIGFNVAGGTLTLDGTQTYTTTSIVNFTAGTLDLGGANLTVGAFNSSNANTRVIAFGANNIILNHATAGTVVLSMATLTNFTWTGTGGFRSDAAVTRTISFGSTIGSSLTRATNLTLTGSGTAALTFSSGCWFNILDFTTTASTIPATSLIANQLTLSAGGTYTALSVTIYNKTVPTPSITSNGNTTGISSLTIQVVTGFVLIGALTVVNTTTVPVGSSLNLNGYNLTTGIISCPYQAGYTSSIAFGSNNIILNSTTPGTTVLSIANATGFTWSGTGGFTTDASITRTFTFGTTGGSSTKAPHLTLTGSGPAVLTFTTGSWFNKLDFGTTAFDPGTTSLNLNSLTLSSDGTYTSLTATMVATGTIIANGKSIPTLTINHSGITQLGSALTTTASVTLTAGTLALAGFTLTSVNFISGTAATRSISGAGTGIISLSANWTVTDGTGWTRFSADNGYKINMTSASSKTFTGANGSYGTLVQAGAGAMTISGSNVFADIQATTRPSTITFTAGTTQTLEAFTLAGTAGNLVTIGSTTPNSAFTLSNPISTSTANYLSIRDCYVTGGAPWYNNNGTNTRLTNNSNWNTAAAAMSLFF